MKSLPIAILAAGATAALFAAPNPIFTDVFTSDPAPIVVGDTCYVITTQDENDGTPGQWLIMNNWRAYSSKNMRDWTYHGVIMDWRTYAWGASDSWASQVVKGADGKFYHYTTLVGKGEIGYGCRCTGVAVSDTPIGPWKDAIGRPLIIDSETPSPYGWDDIDPTVFIDDDGTPWMFWGNPVCYRAKLRKNMIELDGEIKTLALPNYTEGPWIFKRDGLYYLLYVSHNHLGYGEKVSYATATSMDGEWTYRGLLCENPGHDSYGIHPGVCEFKGQWYFFYMNDRLQLENGLHGNSSRRSVAAEYMYFNPDGSIRPIEMTEKGLDAEPLTPEEVRSTFKPVKQGRSSVWKSFAEMKALTWNDPDKVAFSTGNALYYDFPEYMTHRREWNGAETLAQTFTAGKDMTVGKIALFVGNGDGTAETGLIEISLKDRDGRVLAGKFLEYESDFRKPLEVVFDNRPQLKRGGEYLVEIKAPRKTSPIVWFISRKDVYPSGQALRDGKPIADKDGATFDFGLAVYCKVEEDLIFNEITPF